MDMEKKERHRRWNDNNQLKINQISFILRVRFVWLLYGTNGAIVSLANNSPQHISTFHCRFLCFSIMLARGRTVSLYQHLIFPTWQSVIRLLLWLRLKTAHRFSSAYIFLFTFQTHYIFSGFKTLTSSLHLHWRRFCDLRVMRVENALDKHNFGFSFN